MDRNASKVKAIAFQVDKLIAALEAQRQLSSKFEPSKQKLKSLVRKLKQLEAPSLTLTRVVEKLTLANPCCLMQ